MTEQPVPRLRLLVVDDHEVVRQGLVALLDRRSGLEVVAQAGNVAEAVSQAARYEPDVVIMDVRLPDGSGIEVCRAVRAVDPTINALILTSYDDDEALFAAIMAGASGYVLKEIRSSDLVSAVRRVEDDVRKVLQAVVAHALAVRARRLVLPLPVGRVVVLVVRPLRRLRRRGRTGGRCGGRVGRR